MCSETHDIGRLVCRGANLHFQLVFGSGAKWQHLPPLSHTCLQFAMLVYHIQIYQKQQQQQKKVS